MGRSELVHIEGNIFDRIGKVRPTIVSTPSGHTYHGCGNTCYYCIATKLKDEARPMGSTFNEVMDGQVESNTLLFPCNTEISGLNTEQVIDWFKRLARQNKHNIIIPTKCGMKAKPLSRLFPTLLELHEELVQNGKLIVVGVTLSTSDPQVKQIIEPHAPTYQERINCIQELSQMGIPSIIYIKPMLPITDDDLTAILTDSIQAGAQGVRVDPLYASGEDFFLKPVIQKIFPHPEGTWLQTGEGIFAFHDARIGNGTIQGISRRIGLPYQD
jgi:DNA repair photolyase